MAWAYSGLFAQALALNLTDGTDPPSWTLTTNMFYLTNNSDTPAYNGALASEIYSTTDEVHDSAGWPAGGVAVSALASGGTSIAPAIAYGTPSPVLLEWTASSVSVANTTLASPGCYGGYFYAVLASHQYKIIGIYFGGTGYITTAGTFAITWSSSEIATINLSSSAT